ncbi:hypothetical protein [Bacteroides oleiciplenus]|uniref:Uncharacterized protein n=2 Tax=Bacteroides oleiciplenus TaxID=626931 RepID=K9DX30_9BACE|nr:hypothetical protein [Bacteroides oleiciplenus]EKU87786.1 hypothetical protein HMPREF9447_05245 [Bacteroides oleiciplenus YIT 12058]RGN34179.1 hypothetical protein DXB65_13845 [Bacteroides oleiciplenus]
MAKFLKLILILVLATAFWGSVSDAFTKLVDETVSVSQIAMGEDGNIQRNAVRQGSYIPAPQLPYLSDAEIASSGGTTQLLTFSRAQRSYTTEFILSLKDVVGRLAHRDDALSLQRSKLFDTTAFYRCQPACEYYVFTLRRIII